MKHSTTKLKESLRSKKNLAFLTFSLLVLIVLVALLITFIRQPERSVANFCSVAKDQKSILTGNVSYDQQLEAYKKLEAVSPDEIR